MARYGVGLEAVGDLAEQIVDLRLAPCAADTRGGAGDQLRRVHQLAGQQGDQPELHRRGITARAGDQPGVGYRRPVHFRQPVDRLGQAIGAGVGLTVPARPQRRIPQAVVGRQVDHPGAGCQQLGDRVHGDIVRGGEIHHVAGCQLRHFRFGKGKVVVPAQVGEKLIHAAPALGAGCDRHHLRLFMRSQQTQQLDTGVAGAADNANFYHVSFQVLSDHQP